MKYVTIAFVLLVPAVCHATISAPEIDGAGAPLAIALVGGLLALIKKVRG